MLKDGRLLRRESRKRFLRKRPVNKVYGVKPFIIEGMDGSRPYILPLKRQGA